MPTDLETARSQSSIDCSQIGKILFRHGHLERRTKIATVLSHDPIFDKSQKPFLNHTQLLTRALRVCKRLLELRDEQGWSGEEFAEAIRLQDESLPISLHENAFITVLESQGSAEQQEKWLPRCRRYEIIGCYAQTELAHGSNVQGLETVAKYDPATQEFEIFSPRVESAKWWIGGLGVMSNHATVQAILKLPDPSVPGEYKSYGPHLFIVPVRSLTTHEPLPGITIGDMGPKAYGGFGSIDNGYLYMSSVRIPLENMLMRHSKLLPSGEYIPAKHDKLSYGSMVALRAGIPEVLGWTLARAVTIAIRYCITRRQFGKQHEEKQVISYGSAKHRLYPLLAQSYGFIFAGKDLFTLYQSMLEALVERGDVGLLAEVHSLSTALKVKVSWDSAKGIEEARKSMGGHGYSYMSGVGPLFANATPAQTYEGDNYVISQQTARSLLKHVLKLQSSSSYALPDSSSYLRLTLLTPSQLAAKRLPLPVKSPRDWLNPHTQLLALEHRAAFLVSELALAIKNGGMETDISWASARITAAHADVYIVSSFSRAISHNSETGTDACGLGVLSNIHALSTLVAAMSDLFEAGVVDAEQSRGLRIALQEQIDIVEIPQAVGFTDAFAFTDWELGSVLGAVDGKVYERMWEMVRRTDVGVCGDEEREIRKMSREVLDHWKGRKESAKL